MTFITLSTKKKACNGSTDDIKAFLRVIDSLQVSKEKTSDLVRLPIQTYIGNYVGYLNPSKAPETTGITIEFYQFIYKSIIHVVMEAVNIITPKRNVTETSSEV